MFCAQTLALIFSLQAAHGNWDAALKTLLAYAKKVEGMRREEGELRNRRGEVGGGGESLVNPNHTCTF